MYCCFSFLEMEITNVETPDEKINGRLTNLDTKYSILESLQSGGYATVFKAVTNDLESFVAIKTIPKKTIKKNNWIIDTSISNVPIPKEVSIISKLEHENIIGYKGVHEDDKNIYLVMELPSKCQDLFDCYNDKELLSESVIISHFKQIIKGVDYLHSKGYVHRDLKEENILIDEHKNIYITDFGSCHEIPKNVNEYFNDKQGTTTYASPEVLNGFPYSGVEQDMWSLGIVLYVLSFGLFPFRNTTETMFCYYEIPDKKLKKVIPLIRALLKLDVSKRATMEQVKNYLDKIS